jgi:predicted dehydrogenase
MSDKLRIGIIGAGQIFRDRHFPGLAKIADVEVAAICNRSETSARAIAAAFGLDPEFMTDPHALITREDIDAVMIGTWPYMHCPLVLAALDAGKPTFVQARMAMNLREAKAMYAKAEETGLPAQICPSPFTMKGDRFVKRLIREGYLGQVQNINVRSLLDNACDPAAPLHWRHIERYSGLNALYLGILVESVHRWFGYAKQVSAQAETFIKTRPLPGGKGRGPVERPDTVNVLCEMENGATATLLFSGVARFGGAENRIEGYGSEGTLFYSTNDHTILGGRRGDDGLSELTIPEDEVQEWTVEQDFIDLIRTGRQAASTFYEGVKYMEFTEAVFRSVESGRRVTLPIAD